MTLIINVGRRVQTSWFRRSITKVGNLITFQENIWIIICQSLNLAKKKANASGKLTFIITKDREKENLNYEIEWVKVIIQGTREQEKEEYEESLQLYEPLSKILKKEFPKDDIMKRHLITRVLSTTEVEEAYSRGYGLSSGSNVANKLLEMGIITHIKLIDDYDSRRNDVKTDF